MNCEYTIYSAIVNKSLVSALRFERRKMWYACSSDTMTSTLKISNLFCTNRREKTKKTHIYQSKEIVSIFHCAHGVHSFNSRDKNSQFPWEIRPRVVVNIWLCRINSICPCVSQSGFVHFRGMLVNDLVFVIYVPLTAHFLGHLQKRICINVKIRIQFVKILGVIICVYHDRNGFLLVPPVNLWVLHLSSLVLIDSDPNRCWILFGRLVHWH